MLASQRQDQFEAAGQPPGLLAWQVYFLAYVAGIWSLRHPEPALAVAGLLWVGLAAFRARGWRPVVLTLALVAVSFAVGLLHARFVLPDIPPISPAVTDGRSQALLRGRVAEVKDKPFGRLEIVLENVQAETVDNATSAVPGRLSWDWDEPGYRPAPGQDVAVRLRLWPVRGFQNQGGADFDWQQRLRGVFHRAYARGALPDIRWGQRPAHFWWDLRESLRASLLRHLPPTQGGAVLLGLLMGDRSLIGLPVTEELRAAGLAHTLALSGLNVVYVALLGLGLAWLFFSRSRSSRRTSGWARPARLWCARPACSDSGACCCFSTAAVRSSTACSWPWC